MTEVMVSRRRVLELGTGAALALPLFSIGNPALAAEGDLAAEIAAAKAIVSAAAATKIPWDGPTTGPKAQPGKRVILISEDQRNGGALGISQSVTEAAKAIGWHLTVLDGAGVIAYRSAAFAQAIALKPDVIIADNDDYIEQQANIERAAKAGIKVLGWHSTIKPGPWGSHVHEHLNGSHRRSRKFPRHSPSRTPKARLESWCSPTLPRRYPIIKSNAMAANIRACSGCTVLEIIDTPLASVVHAYSADDPVAARPLRQEMDAQPRRSTMGIFDFMAPTLRDRGDSGHWPSGQHRGRRRLPGRIPAHSFAAIPVRDGCRAAGSAGMAVDRRGQPRAGGPAMERLHHQAHLVTAANIGADGGPQDVYDPDNGYRDIYKKIWGV